MKRGSGPLNRTKLLTLRMQYGNQYLREPARQRREKLDAVLRIARLQTQSSMANPQFTGETAASIVISDTIYLMLGTQATFKELTPKEIADPTKVCHTLISLSCESRSAVEALMAKAIAAGGSQTHEPEDHGFM